jgi:hypothetical protein
LTCKRDFAAGVYLSEAQNLIPPIPLIHCIRKKYIYSHREGGREGRVKPERKLEEQQFIKLGLKYQDN